MEKEMIALATGRLDTMKGGRERDRRQIRKGRLQSCEKGSPHPHLLEKEREYAKKGKGEGPSSTSLREKGRRDLLRWTLENAFAAERKGFSLFL